eukprot:XP_011667690.1 PREDICTED: hormonally up-regulated neu tumor-associated kinase [Strongylocentrotus purpuratus]
MSRLRSVGRYSVEDQTIGKGNFAVVELATHTVTKTKVALKVIEKRKITKPYVKKNLTREARIMSQLRHPNIVRLYETITSPQLYCLIMEYVPGRDLLTLVRGQKGGRLKEGVARRFVRQLVSALHHMHEHGIVHRDLKMENIMMDKQRENVKIIDFGLSNQCGPEELFKTHCGSPEYAAPELYVAGRDYGPEVDIWSLGVIMFAMVTGKLPFTTPHSENRRQHLLLQIKKGLKGVHDKEMAHLTDDCKDIGVIMFAMVTGKLPFTTPHSENRRQHLLLQIKKGLKGVHDKEMAHLTDDPEAWRFWNGQTVPGPHT